MRLISLLATIALLCTACGERQRGPVDTLELGAGNRNATVNKDGKGKFHFAHAGDEPFTITPQTFRQIEARLASYRSGATPKTKLDLNASFCPDPLPHATDQGFITVRWIGPDADEFLIIDRGCDRDRNAARNRDLLAILDMLPVPKTPDWDLPQPTEGN